jgi:Ca2+-binding EF-hand superfamily protein
MDADNSGQIGLDELDKFVRLKAKTNPSWNILVSNPQIIDLVHQEACIQSASGSGVVVPSNPKDRLVSMENFRALLIHLYAASILWTHFVNADSWQDAADVGNRQLNFEEFRLGCITLSRDRMGDQQQLDDEQLQKDFDMLDINRSGSISFAECCNYCFHCINGAYDVENKELVMELISPSRKAQESVRFSSKSKGLDSVSKFSLFSAFSHAFSSSSEVTPGVSRDERDSAETNFDQAMNTLSKLAAVELMEAHEISEDISRSAKNGHHVPIKPPHSEVLHPVETFRSADVSVSGSNPSV